MLKDTKATIAVELAEESQSPEIKPAGGATFLGATPIDLNSLRLTQDYADAFGAKKLITNVPIAKTRKDQFIRVHRDEDRQLSVMVLEIKGRVDGSYYLLKPAVWGVLPGLERPVVLRLAVDRSGGVFLIPVPLPGPDGKRNPWGESLAQAMPAAEKNWCRISANMGTGSYDVLVATGLIEEPKWPTETFAELVGIAFRGAIIEDAEHIVIRQLLGLA